MENQRICFSNVGINLVKHSLDISTDIDVLEQMLRRDGFTENEIVENARTAAEAQMRYSSAPVMNFPIESDKTDVQNEKDASIQHE